MKKLFLTICLTALLSGTAIAACDGGTEYTVDGDTFCISDITLNWWSASNWCQANGMHLATVYEVCPDWNGTTGNTCGRTFSFDDYCWTTTANGSEKAFDIYPSGGGVYTSSRNGDRRDHALCAN